MFAAHSIAYLLSVKWFVNAISRKWHKENRVNSILKSCILLGFPIYNYCLFHQWFLTRQSSVDNAYVLTSPLAIPVVYWTYKLTVAWKKKLHSTLFHRTSSCYLDCLHWVLVINAHYGNTCPLRVFLILKWQAKTVMYIEENCKVITIQKEGVLWL